MSIRFRDTQGPYGYLSSSSAHGFSLRGSFWRTVEHFLLALKESPTEDLMKEALWAKFTQHPDLGEKLLATGQERLIEEGPDGKDHWGRLLMEVRTRLAAEKK